MKPAAWFERSTRHRAWRRQLLRWLMQDLAGVARQPEHDHRTHLRSTLEWLVRAPDTAGGGVAAGWNFESGWLGATPETTAALIETCLPAADYLAWPELDACGQRLLNALFAKPGVTSPAQLHGFLAGRGRQPEALSRAKACATALREAALSTVHMADAAHALARLAAVSGEPVWRDAARTRLEATLARQTPCGWFATSPQGPAALYDLAGVIRGAAEAAALLDDVQGLRAAERAGQALYERLGDDGRMAGAYDDGWMPAAEHASLPGLARLAACWLRLAQLGEGHHWREGAWRVLSWIKHNQRIGEEAGELRGALPNAVPLWQGPGAFGFDVLGAKYFADALMMDMVGIAIPATAPHAEPA